MDENIRKTLLYFKKWDSYWKLTNDNEKLKAHPGPLGRYPLDFRPRIKEGHYIKFDSNGIPMWLNSAGSRYIYHYTTMFSYALGQFENYLVTAEEEYKNNVIAVANYILKSGYDTDRGFLLKESDDLGFHKGVISAMVQGEAMSVLSRAFSITDDQIYFDTALNCLIPFNYLIDEGGVVGVISYNNTKWYEEYITKPLHHVLNGMIYSLWGLRDLFLLTKNNEAKLLFENGLQSLDKSLPLFDSGSWSYYRVSESQKNYTASMMYHNLHICQLLALYSQTNNSIYKVYADKFISYADNPINRISAAAEITKAKVANKLKYE